MRLASSASADCPQAEEQGMAHASVVAEKLLLDSGEHGSQTPVSPDIGAVDTSSLNAERLRLLRRTLMDQQQQLLRQREHLQQQHLLLMQHSHERNVAPHNLAQLFADLHEARQQRFQQTVSRISQTMPVQRFDGHTPGTVWRHFSGKACSGEAQFSTRSRQQPAQRIPAGMAGPNRGHSFWDQSKDPQLYSGAHREHVDVECREGAAAASRLLRRRTVRSAALVDVGKVLDSTVSSLQARARNLQGPEESQTETESGGSNITSSSSSSKSSIIINRRDRVDKGDITSSSRGVRSFLDSSSGRAIKVHAQALPASALCSGLTGRTLWRHCLRVTLNARRCAIRTRRSWRVLVSLFPQRSSYSPAAVFSDDDLGSYTQIGLHTGVQPERLKQMEFWEPPREPFTSPGLYCLVKKDGPVVAAWAVAMDNTGRLRRCTASVDSGVEEKSRAASVFRRKRQKPLEPFPYQEENEEPLGTPPVGGDFWKAGSVQALKTWYARVTNQPLTPQQTQCLSLEGYAEAFSSYAGGLVTSLKSLLEIRGRASSVGREPDSCGCRCSICAGLPCRVRVTWRRKFLAFELAIEKRAAHHRRSDSSDEESDADKGEGMAHSRSAAAARSRGARWEWCRRCPMGCRMQLRLVLHELYQPLSLTLGGLRSALAQLLLRLRSYVVLTPLAVSFLLRRVQEIRSAPCYCGAGAAGLEKTGATDVAEGCSGVAPLQGYSWATRDWAELCWLRRQQRRPDQNCAEVVASHNLDGSVARLSMLASSLCVPSATGDVARAQAALPEGGGESGCLVGPANLRTVAEGAAEQLRLLAEGSSQRQVLRLSGGLEAQILRLPAGSVLGAGTQEYEDSEARTPRFSYPVSVASSQAQSACSTPPKGCRPRIGRCFATAQQHQDSDGMAGEVLSAKPLECDLHIQCDGIGRTRRGTPSEGELGRPSYGDDGEAKEEVTSSPRGLRRMQRARLAGEESQPSQQLRQMEVSRRVMPLVPWWWGNYVRSQGSFKTDLKVEDCGSDGSSSVSSTVSLAPSPHLFRLKCGEPLRAGSDGLSARPRDFAAVEMLEKIKNEVAAAVEEKPRSSSNELFSGTSVPSVSPKAEVLDASENPSGVAAVELIHAAAQLVDGLDRWPLDIGTSSSSAGIVEAQSRKASSAKLADRPAVECFITEPAVQATGTSGRRSRQQRGFFGGPTGVSEPRNSQNVVTFVSAVVAAPGDGEVECLKGFELLEGVLYSLFAPAIHREETLQEGVLNDVASEDTAGPLDIQLAPTQLVKASSLRPPTVSSVKDSVYRSEDSVLAGTRSRSSPPLDLHTSTPLLRSLAASTASPVDPSQGRLVVDDFYARPILKRAVSYRDTYEPFDKDYTDVQIRLKPLRAFGSKQQRNPRYKRRSWRTSTQSSSSSPQCTSPAPSRSQKSIGLKRRPLQGVTGRVGSVGALGERTGTVKIGGRRVVVRTLEGSSAWASREQSTAGLSDFSVSRCSISVDSSLSSRGVSLCSRATSNAGSASDGSARGSGTPQSPNSTREGGSRHRRGRSRVASGTKGSSEGGNSSTPTGVYLDVARKLWRCQWRENGRFKTKSFPLNQYKTLKEARRACVIFRCLMGGWEVQPAWLGDDSGGDADPSEQPENVSTQSEGNVAVTDVLKPTDAGM